MTQPKPDRAGFSPRRKAPRSPLLLLLLLLVVGAVLAGVYALGRPRLAFGNRLIGPVRLTVAGDQPRIVAAGETLSVPTSSGNSTLVAWELVRPLSADGNPMGDEVRGTLLLRHRWGTTYHDATARGPNGDYFAPLITNASQDLLRIRVNAGLEGALDCGCAVRPGARRAFIGYYRLYENSTVQARAEGRRTAAFRDLGPKVTAADGTIGLRFETKDLRVPG